MSYLKPSLKVIGGLAMVIALVVAGLIVRAWKERREWVVSRAVDGGACGKTSHIYLRAAAPRASRELFEVDIACRAQIVRTLRTAPNFVCHSDGRLTVCEHPLNADDSTTYVRAILTRSHVLLETIPT